MSRGLEIRPDSVPYDRATPANCNDGRDGHVTVTPRDLLLRPPHFLDVMIQTVQARTQAETIAWHLCHYIP